MQENRGDPAQQDGVTSIMSEGAHPSTWQEFILLGTFREYLMMICKGQNHLLVAFW